MKLPVNKKPPKKRKPQPVSIAVGTDSKPERRGRPAGSKNKPKN